MTVMTLLLAAVDPSTPALTASEVPARTNRTVTITSDRADYDRRDGVIFLDGHVRVRDSEMSLCSDRLHVFVDGTNQLKRIVVTGNVAITNGLRNGACNRATYVRGLNRIIMFGVPGQSARMVDDGKNRSVIEGAKITFWTDSEQVEVEEPTITLEGVPARGLMDSVRRREEVKSTAKTEIEEEKEESKENNR